MALTQMTDDLNIIAKLGDKPNTDNNMSADELKAKFDKAGLLIQEYLNNTLLPNILGKSGGTMTGNIAMGGNMVTGLGTPSDEGDAASKKYVDNKFIGYRGILTSEDDLDKIVTPGIYYYLTGGVPANCPYSNAGIVEVIATGSTVTRILQRVTRYGAEGYTKQRVLYNSSWSAWTAVPLMFKKTYTSTTNSNGNANTSITYDYIILAIYATDEDGNELYLCHPYRSDSTSSGRWFCNVTHITSKANVLNTTFTFTIYYALA